MAHLSEAPQGGATPALIRWGAVFGGVVIGFSVLALLVALWSALAFGSGLEGMQDNFDWLVAISAVLAMLIGGLLAGWLSGVRGFGPGFFNGLAVWGLIVIVGALVGLPGVLQLGFELPTVAQEQALWTGFLAMLVGALAAGLAGAAGGAMTRPAAAYGPYYGYGAYPGEEPDRRPEPDRDRPLRDEDREADRERRLREDERGPEERRSERAVDERYERERDLEPARDRDEDTRVTEGARGGRRLK